MKDSNVIPFAPALLRLRERQRNRAAYANRYAPWHSRHSEGIDGLWTEPSVDAPSFL